MATTCFPGAFSTTCVVAKNGVEPMNLVGPSATYAPSAKTLYHDTQTWSMLTDVFATVVLKVSRNATCWSGVWFPGAQTYGDAIVAPAPWRRLWCRCCSKFEKIYISLEQGHVGVLCDRARRAQYTLGVRYSTGSTIACCLYASCSTG